MLNEIKSYGIRSLLIAVLTAIFSYFLFSTKLSEYYLPVFPILLGVFFIVYLLTHVILITTHERNKKRFVPAFMITFAIKFFLILGILLIYFFFDRKNIINFTVGLFLLYLIFTIFQVFSLIRYVRKKT